jgi:hypothetical protein
VGDRHGDSVHTEPQFAAEGSAPVIGNIAEPQLGAEIVVGEVVDIDSVLQ